MLLQPKLLHPTILNNIAHPLIASAFIKQGFNQHVGNRCEKILVLDARHITGKSARDVRAALIADMDLILDQVRRSPVKIDSVEIRAH